MQNNEAFIGVDNQQKISPPAAFWPASSWCIIDLPHLATYWLRLCLDNWPWW
ncbi:MAG: hypothetical protein GY869_06230 [Planctomycetes bacterium]|nr:hypothetical protein [Planctomycetota bacterium]